MVDLVAGQHPRQQKFPRKKNQNQNQRCEDWDGPEEQKATLGAEEDSARVGDGDVQ